MEVEAETLAEVLEEIPPEVDFEEPARKKKTRKGFEKAPLEATEDEEPPPT